MTREQQKYEDATRAYCEAKSAFSSRLRAWIAQQEPKPTTTEGFDALERRYAVEHPDEVAEIEALATEVNVASAALNERWIRAHEDLAVLRKAGLLQS